MHSNPSQGIFCDRDGSMCGCGNDLIGNPYIPYGCQGDIYAVFLCSFPLIAFFEIILILGSFFFFGGFWLIFFPLLWTKLKIHAKYWDPTRSPIIARSHC